MAISHCGNDSLFVFEVAVDEANADTSFTTDVVHAGLMKPAFGEADYSGIKDLGTSIWVGRILLGL
ncbi:MAG: hypothetical protein ACREFF_04985 [Candidatus Udaeobacter sp.]